MGLLDKVKNLFTEPEEPEEEIKIEQIKREVSRIPSEVKNTESRSEYRSEHRREKTLEDLEESFTEEFTKEQKPTLPPVQEKVKTPVFFTENDFADLEPERPKRVEKKKEVVESKPIKKEEKRSPYSGSYTSTTLITKEKPTFKPTPIISPIYGILDKNYSKEDIVEKKEVKETLKDSKSKDKFDEVRSKAYGLESDLERSLYKSKKKEDAKTLENDFDLFDELEEKYNNKKNEQKTLAKSVNEQEKNIRELEEITMDLTKELDNLLLKKDSYNKKGKRELEEINDDEPMTENELFNLIDSMYEEGKE